MTFEHNPNHVNNGLLKFAGPFWGKPRWAALYAAFGREVQELEDAAVDVITSLFLDNATGARLAMLGKIVGQLDPGLGEAIFKLLIRVRIRINRSEGSRDDVIEVLQLLGIPKAQRTIANDFPAKIRVTLTGTLPLPIELLTQLINQTLSAGVGANVIWAGTGAFFAFTNATVTAGANNLWGNEATSGTPWAAVYQV